MAGTTLKAILSPRSEGSAVLAAVREQFAPGICIVDASGKYLLGDSATASLRQCESTPILLDGVLLGYVIGSSAQNSTVALLLQHLAGRDSENRALASEVLHLYREIHLIEELSEQLAPLLDVEAVAKSALDQAQRLITATHGSILVMEKADSPLSTAASFGGSGDPSPVTCLLAPESPIAASILQRGIGEIVNDCVTDPRILDTECAVNALICAPLRAGQRTVGVITLGNSVADAAYSAADLQLLNTIALQTASAIENSLLCAEMVEAARERAAYAAELQAASSVQQLLLAGASRPTPGFKVESVYLPASEVGGDFFFVSPAPDGSLTAILGDVSGKGLPAAMRVAMILGAIRRESSHDPRDILAGLNNVLIAQGQLGFTTGCCIRISLDGSFSLANAGHIAPYVSGREVVSPSSLPLGIAEAQSYELVHGKLEPEEHIVLLSDGVPESRSKSGELYGFERLNHLTQLAARDIAETARAFGQEDDITVLTIRLMPH